MSASSTQSKSKKSSTKSTTTPQSTKTAPKANALPSASPPATASAKTAAHITPATGASPAPATTGVTSTPTPIDTLAAKAIAALDALEPTLNLDIVIPPNDQAQMRTLKRVTNAAIDLAAQIVKADPQRFSDFAGLPAAADYVDAMTGLYQRAALFATHVENSLQNQRAPAATQTLALYAVVKGLGRLVDNQTMRELTPQLKAALVPPRRNPKPKETATQKAVKRAARSQQKKLQKATQVLAAAGVTPPPTAPPTGTSPATPAVSGVAPATSNGAAVSH